MTDEPGAAVLGAERADSSATPLPIPSVTVVSTSL
jgi:hypothetical protein